MYPTVVMNFTNHHLGLQINSAIGKPTAKQLIFCVSYLYNVNRYRLLCATLMLVGNADKS